jgi:hypothetical protein
VCNASSFLTRLVSRLGPSGVEYMVAGSFASTFHGVPRTTHDIDVVEDLTFSGLTKLLAVAGATLDV